MTSWRGSITSRRRKSKAFTDTRRFRFIETGDVEGEDLYAAMSRTAAGRYLTIITIYFVYKTTKEALIISAREMTKKEKRSYAKK